MDTLEICHIKKNIQTSTKVQDLHILSKKALFFFKDKRQLVQFLLIQCIKLFLLQNELKEIQK